MARPPKNNVDYFPFICEEGNKMFYLEETYGNDGFATFVKLLRELGKTDFHYLNLSKSKTLMYLSAKCKVTKEVLLAIINDLVDLEKFDKTLWEEDKVIWCQDFINGIQDAYKKRNNECITYEGLISLLEGLGVRKQSKSSTKVVKKPQSKGEDNKQEKNKEDLDARKLKFSTTLEPFLGTYGNTLLNEFYSYWTEPNKSKTKFRQELERTWSLERRLKTWAKNDRNFSKNGNNESTEQKVNRQTTSTIKKNASGWGSSRRS